MYAPPIPFMTASNNFLVRVVVIIACLSVGLGRPGPAATQPLAAETKSAPVTLREATAHAIARLPDTAAYQALRDQVAAQRRASRGPFIGPPVVRSDVLVRSGGFTEQEAAVSAAIRWPGEGRSQRLAADRSGDAADATLDEARLIVAGDVRAAWWALALSRAIVTVERAQIGFAETEVAQVGRLVRAGEQSRRDLLMAQGERGTAQARLSVAETDLANALSAYKALIGAPPEDFPAEAQARQPDLDLHPLVRAASARSAAAESRAGALRFGNRPRIEASVGVRRERTDPLGDYDSALMLGVAVPLGRDPAAVAETAGARADAIRASAEAVRVGVRLAADQASATRRLEIAGVALTDAQTRRNALAEALALTTRGRREGEIGFVEYLRARQALSFAERDYAAARVAAAAAVSDFNQAQGVLP